MKWFCCNIIFHLQGEFVCTNDASVILFGLAVHISLKFLQSNAILPQVLFWLVLLYRQVTGSFTIKTLPD